MKCKICEKDYIPGVLQNICSECWCDERAGLNIKAEINGFKLGLLYAGFKAACMAIAPIFGEGIQINFTEDETILEFKYPKYVPGGADAVVLTSASLCENEQLFSQILSNLQRDIIGA